MFFKCLFKVFLIIEYIRSLQGAEMNVTKEINKQNSGNFSSIKWAHAVNNNKELENALKSNIDMIEADIVRGKLIKNHTGPEIPIMAHPPNTTSDITLEIFLKKIAAHNKNNKAKEKGVKLDFKTIEVFKDSKTILKTNLPLMNCPIWLNADVLPGPVNATTKPVDAEQFFQGCKEFKNITLSVGWTTMWGKNFTDDSYSKNQINDMIMVVKKNNIINQQITFPVRAGIAAQSINQLDELIKQSNPTNKATLTIWSLKDDYVNVDKLRNLIKKIGVDKIYLDVPNEILNNLHLDKNSTISRRSLVNFSIICLCLFIAVVALQRKNI